MMPESLVADRRALVVRGRVQGVGFRWWTRSTAMRLGLTGCVRNRPDGAVELIAEGQPAALDDFSALLRRGPPAARVERIDVLDGAAAEALAAGCVQGEFRIAT